MTLYFCEQCCLWGGSAASLGCGVVKFTYICFEKNVVLFPMETTSVKHLEPGITLTNNPLTITIVVLRIQL